MLHPADPSERLLIADYDGKVLYSLECRAGQYVFVQEPQATQLAPTSSVPVPASLPLDLHDRTPTAISTSATTHEPTVAPVMPQTAEQPSGLAAVATMAAASIAPPQAGVMSARTEQPCTSTAGVAAPSLPMSAPVDAEALRCDERQRITLHNILLELHSAFPGIENAIIATLDGRVLSALYPAQGTSLAAMTSAMYPLATHTDRLLGGGGLKQLLVRYATVTLVVYPIAEVATLSVLSAAHGNIGMLRSTCREAIGKIVEVLKR